VFNRANLTQMKDALVSLIDLYIDLLEQPLRTAIVLTMTTSCRGWSLVIRNNGDK